MSMTRQYLHEILRVLLFTLSDIIRSLRTELAQLKGDNEVLRREVERLRSEVQYDADG